MTRFLRRASFATRLLRAAVRLAGRHYCIGYLCMEFDPDTADRMARR